MVEALVSEHVALAVHQPIIRDGLEKIIADGPMQRKIHSATDFEELLKIIALVPMLSLAIICLALPGMSRVNGVHRLRTRHSRTPVLIIAEQADRGMIIDLIAAGANGVVPLAESADQFQEAVATVGAGGIYVPSSVASNPTELMATSSRKWANSRMEALTARQHDVLNLLAEGRTNKQIARQLDISPHTVNMHIRSVFRSLGVHNRVEAARISANGSYRDAMSKIDHQRRAEDFAPRLPFSIA